MSRGLRIIAVVVGLLLGGTGIVLVIESVGIQHRVDGAEGRVEQLEAARTAADIEFDEVDEAVAAVREARQPVGGVNNEIEVLVDRLVDHTNPAANTLDRAIRLLNSGDIAGAAEVAREAAPLFDDADALRRELEAALVTLGQEGDVLDEALS